MRQREGQVWNRRWAIQAQLLGGPTDAVAPGGKLRGRRQQLLASSAPFPGCWGMAWGRHFLKRPSHPQNAQHCYSTCKRLSTAWKPRIKFKAPHKRLSTKETIPDSVTGSSRWWGAGKEREENRIIFKDTVLNVWQQNVKILFFSLSYSKSWNLWKTYKVIGNNPPSLATVQSPFHLNTRHSTTWWTFCNIYILQPKTE